MSQNKETLKSTARKTKHLSAVGALSLTAALSPALSPNRAQAASPNHKTSIAALARMIEVQGPSPQANVELFANLPNGQKAEITMQSASTNPKDVKYVDVFVYKPEANKAQAYANTVIDFTFTKQPDGTWNAGKQVANPKQPDSLLDTVVNNSASVSTYSQVVENNSVVDTHVTEVNNRAVAHQTIVHLQEQAGRVLTHILAGEAVPPAELH
jgi:hypothetical protein